MQCLSDAKYPCNTVCFLYKSIYTGRFLYPLFMYTTEKTKTSRYSDRFHVVTVIHIFLGEKQKLTGRFLLFIIFLIGIAGLYIFVGV